MLRKKFIIPAVILLVSSFSFQSCIGSFSLTNKVLTWNRQVNNKFINELVFFAFWVLPVYEVTAIADLLVINSIEFWSGNKPLEANNQLIDTDHGQYQILANESGYKVITPEGECMIFAYDKKTSTWSFGTNETTMIDFMHFVDENHVQILNAEGEFVDVEVSREGVNQYMSSINAPLMALR